MRDPGNCPICGYPELMDGGDAKLDQSPDTYLPARAYVCPKCPDTTVTVPTGKPYAAEPWARPWVPMLPEVRA